MGLSNLSAANGTQQVQSQPKLNSRAKKVLDEMQIHQKTASANGKKVTNEDIDKAMNEPSGRNVIISLLKKSPIGFTQPTAVELSKNGYSVSMNGDRYTGPGGYGEWGEPAQDGSVNMTYKTEKFEQHMIYNKDGNVQSGTLIIRDDFGNIERQLDFIMQENGKMTVIQ